MSQGAHASPAGSALDGLLRALTLEPLGNDRFRAESERAQFARIFGGQTLAQAVVAAGATVDEQLPHSLHAYFSAAGTPGVPLEIDVDRVRDGGSVSVRRVAVIQDDRPLLTAIVSFHANTAGTELADRPPAVPAPEDLPRIQHWAAATPPDLRAGADRWIEQPPPVELRIGEPPFFLGGPPADGPRCHWMRVAGEVGDDPLLHSALIAYASDYFLLDMILRAHPEPPPLGKFFGFSMDHAIWFHRATRADRWHLHQQQAVAITGERGLVRGSIYDDEGRLAATVMQEVLIRAGR